MIHLPSIPKISEESVFSILTSLYNKEGEKHISNEQSLILSDIVFNKTNEKVLSINNRYFIYEIIGILITKGYEITKIFLEEDWIAKYNNNNNNNNYNYDDIRKFMLMQGPTMEKARNKFNTDLDIYRNTIEVSVGSHKCKRCGSTNTMSLPVQNRGGDEATAFKVSCVDCKNKWTA